MRKLLILLAFVLTFALVAGALAENEATEVEALDEEIAAENVDATPGETDAALSEEIEADLTPDAEEEPPEETSGEVRVEEDSTEEESAEEEASEEESVEEESSEEASSEDEDAAENEDAPVDKPAEDAEAPADEPAADGGDEQVVEAVVEEVPAEAETAEAEALMDLLTDEAAAPIAVEGLVYTGEPQALVIGPTDGTVHYSLDGENFAPEIPTGINAGEYTVYYKRATATETSQEADEAAAATAREAGEEAVEAVAAEEAQEAVQDAETEDIATLTVTIAKADVVFTPPVAITETV